MIEKGMIWAGIKADARIESARNFPYPEKVFSSRSLPRHAREETNLRDGKFSNIFSGFLVYNISFLHPFQTKLGSYFCSYYL